MYDACARAVTAAASQAGVGLVMENLQPLCTTFERGEL